MRGGQPVGERDEAKANNRKSLAYSNQIWANSDNFIFPPFNPPNRRQILVLKFHIQRLFLSAIFQSRDCIKQNTATNKAVSNSTFYGNDLARENKNAMLGI